jgi:hypothetical protein
MVHQGPVIPPSTSSQGPELQREVLRTPRFLSEVEQSLTRCFALWWVVEYSSKTAGELWVEVPCRVWAVPDSVGPVQGPTRQTGDEEAHTLLTRGSRMHGSHVELELEQKSLASSRRSIVLPRGGETQCAGPRGLRGGRRW